MGDLGEYRMAAAVPLVERTVCKEMVSAFCMESESHKPCLSASAIMLSVSLLCVSFFSFKINDDSSVSENKST